MGHVSVAVRLHRVARSRQISVGLQCASAAGPQSHATPHATAQDHAMIPSACSSTPPHPSRPLHLLFAHCLSSIDWYWNWYKEQEQDLEQELEQDKKTKELLSS
ncbi:hypothetical protein KVV02_000851 [Mortierella alpina]|uniref:Uncharacterized protein n=1 Tax=Mortierella alpina TaxID=64518 RepID=A0A9P8CX09_MORAP|nr:hypothetical protein KVV02_000851 [Mortierella alpina]